MSDSSHTEAPSDDADIVVVGAGIIGTSCALALARQGLRVTVIDAQEPGHGASYGNAGHLATEQVSPIADLSILKQIPAMLINPMGPLRLDWKYLPRALPWFTRLLLNLRSAPFQRTVAGLRTLNEASLGAWERTLASMGCGELLQARGSLLVYERRETHTPLETLRKRWLQQGVDADLWSAHALQDAAPALSDHLLGGIYFPKTGHFIDPHLVVCRLAEAAKACGVRFVQQQVRHGRLNEKGAVLITSQGPLNARRVLIACGAHSAALVSQLTGISVPLDTERGYHLMLPHEHGRLPFPVTSLERKFIMTPMQGGLRLAGTVEFAGLHRPPRMDRAWQLHRLSQGLFRQDLDARDATTWMGLRPSLPDSLPVIDQVCDGRVLLAFGHQHLGLTQAAITAEWIAQLAVRPMASIASQALPDLSAYRLDRFRKPWL
ncbi:NAD(P)/FAD-dependent oxidoreductase [Comamonas koreensis]|uniref:FAD-binding oxidoreductase n=1 Tax=Comamonas koreensis TaxID=160825 RepID=A0AAW4XWE5_9BURK|nr:FAD-dependent oxidoreductase [Comamonas koreensis]MCD2165541.1 FAD-binding oxidoreductase [Comamonas koreensis]